MAFQPKDFVTLFHSLEGETIGDRKKNFNKLLRNPSFSTNKQKIHDALDKLEPKTYLESIFKLDSLIYFKYTDRLFEVIKGGNEVFTSKILKQNWFFEEKFRNMDANLLVNDYLPCLSFSMRMKVLKKLCLVLDENKMDDIYDSLFDRYGLWIASKILHTCTTAKIEFVLKNEEINLRVNQVLHLFDRDVCLLDLYLDYYKKTFKHSYSERKITNRIALKNPIFMLKLKKEEKMLVSDLGRRTSKYIFDLVKSDISRDFDSYKNLLNKAIFVKKLGGEFKSIYFNLFPKKIDEIGYYSECRKILKYYPKNGRWPLFVNTFETKFPSKDVYETYYSLGKYIKSLNPNKETSRKLAEYIYKKYNNERVLKYLPTSKAIPLIKEKINVTSDASERGRLVKILLQTCKKNQDLTALEEVLKYVSVRHRNEDLSFRKNFIQNLERKFELNKLNENHWKYIMEHFNILKFKQEYNFWEVPVILRRRLEFRLKNGENIQSYITEYIQFVIAEQQSFKLDIKNPEVEQKLLVEIIKMFEEIIQQHPEDTKDDYTMILMVDVMKFCIKYPEYFIDLGHFPYLKTFFQQKKIEVPKLSGNYYELVEKFLHYKYKFPQTTLSEYNDELIEIIIECCKKEIFHLLEIRLHDFFLKSSRSAFENKLLKAYFDNVNSKIISTHIIDWFLKYEPAFLVPYFHKICKEYPKINIKIIKNLSHFNFDKEMKKIFVTALESDDIDRYVDVVQTLSVLLPTNEFVTFIDNKFTPQQTKLDPEDEEDCKRYEVLCNIVKELGNVEEPFKILPLVLKFCIGDYLQSVLPSLQSVFYRSPEKAIYPYIVQLSNKAVSVRKHAIFLGSELLKKDYVMQLLSKDESNVSSQKSRFRATLKYLKKNPCDILRNLLFTYMSTIDRNDTESLDRLAEVVVPNKYKGLYIEKCWEYYENLQNEDVNVDKYFESLLKCVDCDMGSLSSLPSKLIEKIIKEYYFKISNPYLTGRVIVQYLNDKCETEEVLFEILVNKLKTLKKAEVGEFFSSLQSCLKLSTTFIVKLTKIWKEHFSLIIAFSDTIFLDLLSLDCTSTSSKNLAKSIIEYTEALTAKFSLGITSLLREVFTRYVSTKCSNEDYELLEDMVKTKPNVLTSILVLGALKPVDNDDTSYEIFLRISQTVSSIEEPLVAIYYDMYLKKYNFE